MKRAKVKMMMVPVAVAMVLALVMALVTPVALAGKPPQFNEIYPTDVSVENTPPVMLNGGIAIIDNAGNVVWDNVPDACKNCTCWPFPAGEPRSDSYIWESEKLVVYAIIHDDNGISDLKQHTAMAWLSFTDANNNYEPMYRFVTDMELCQCTLNAEGTEGCFMGEYLIPTPDMLRCHYDVTITDSDKYGATGTCEETGLPWNVVHDCLFINPMVTSQLSYIEDPDNGERVPASAILWMDPPLVAGETREADQSPFSMHVEARCNDLTVTVPYQLSVRGTNLEGGIGNAESIPVECLEYSLDSGVNWLPMSNAEQLLGEYESCQYVDIHLKITVPWIEPANYSGQIGFDIKVL